MRDSKQKTKENRQKNARFIKQATPSDLSGTSESMQIIISNAYVFFKQYTVPNYFDVCLRCCVSEEEYLALKTIPLPLIPVSVIRSYNESAKVEQQDINELRYLLPRILELTATYEYIYHDSELNLKRLGQVDNTKWCDAERQILADFAAQFMRDSFLSAQNDSKTICLDELLIMFYKAGIDVQPLLNMMTEVTEFYGVSSIAHLIFQERSDDLLSNSFASDLPILSELINQWLFETASQLVMHAERAILNTPNSINHLSEMERYWIEQNLCALQELSAH